MNFLFILYECEGVGYAQLFTFTELLCVFAYLLAENLLLWRQTDVSLYPHFSAWLSFGN